MSETCHGCGGYPDADWTICSTCKKQQMEEALGEEVYIDGLGIAWTKKDLEDAGGRNEVDRLVSENNAMIKKIYNKSL